MKSEEFDKIMLRRFALANKVMGTKAGEYASDKNRLHNFDVAAAIVGCTPAQALLGMLVKHLVSVVDLVNSGEAPSEAVADEKIGDCINYLILLEAVWAEERKTKEQAKTPTLTNEPWWCSEDPKPEGGC